MSMPANLEKIIASCTAEMLATVDGLADAMRTASPETSLEPTPIGVASVLGYSGEQMKGSLVISAERALLAATHPNLAIGMPVDDTDVLDWSGEIANQVLGRIKNRLSTIGITFSMSTPTTVSGKSMQIRAPKDGYATEFVFTGGKGSINLHFLAVIAAGVSFDREATAAAASEGDSLLF